MTSKRLTLTWWLMMLLLLQGAEAMSKCCKCPAVKCDHTQWPCCNKNTKWWIKFFG